MRGACRRGVPFRHSKNNTKSGKAIGSWDAMREPREREHVYECVVGFEYIWGREKSGAAAPRVTRRAYGILAVEFSSDFILALLFLLSISIVHCLFPSKLSSIIYFFPLLPDYFHFYLLTLPIFFLNSQQVRDKIMFWQTTAIFLPFTQILFVTPFCDVHMDIKSPLG